MRNKVILATALSLAGFTTSLWAALDADNSQLNNTQTTIGSATSGAGAGKTKHLNKAGRKAGGTQGSIIAVRKAGEKNLTLHDKDQLNGNLKGGGMNKVNGDGKVMLNGGGKEYDSWDKHASLKKSNGLIKGESGFEKGTSATGGAGAGKAQDDWEAKNGKAGISSGGDKSLNFTRHKSNKNTLTGSTKNSMGDGSAKAAVSSGGDRSGFEKSNGLMKDAAGGAGGAGGQLPAVQTSH